jgi:hypothetical protein
MLANKYGVLSEQLSTARGTSLWCSRNTVFQLEHSLRIIILKEEAVEFISYGTEQIRGSLRELLMTYFEKS